MVDIRDDIGFQISYCLTYEAIFQGKLTRLSVWVMQHKLVVFYEVKQEIGDTKTSRVGCFDGFSEFCFGSAVQQSIEFLSDLAVEFSNLL